MSIPVYSKEVVAGWLAQFSLALSSDDIRSVLSCFHPDAWLRDALVFTWDNRSLEGTEKISNYLTNTFKTAQVSSLELDLRAGLVPEYGPISPWASGVSSGFTFSTWVGTGKGYVQLRQAEGDDCWKAHLVFMMLDELKGYEEMDAEEGVYGGHTLAWSDVAQERRQSVENNPHVLIGTLFSRPRSASYDSYYI